MTNGFWSYAVISFSIAAVAVYAIWGLGLLVCWYLRRRVGLRITVFDYLARHLLNADQLTYLRSKYRQIWHPNREPLLKDRIVLYMEGDFTDMLGTPPQEYAIDWQALSEAEDRFHKDLAAFSAKHKHKYRAVTIYPKADEEEPGRGET